MDRPISYDKLAREDRFVRMRARDVAELKVAQGLPAFPDLSSRESIKERVHGIMVGELQAMEGAGRERSIGVSISSTFSRVSASYQRSETSCRLQPIG